MRSFRTKSENRALRRLKKEYEELLGAPIENCAACPKMNREGDIVNLLEWHVNIMSTSDQLQGTPFHFIMSFPKNYPDAAPKVRPVSYISHPNVFGDYICLDILSMSEETTTTAYRGWTNAYTVSSILVQLQSFLFEVCPNASDCARMIQDATAPCSCGHNLENKCFPEVVIQNQNISRVYSPGIYIVTHLGGITLRENISKNSKDTRKLPEGTQIQIVEIKEYEDENRIRGQLAEGDWVSIEDTTDGYNWVLQLSDKLSNTTVFRIGDRVRVIENFETISRAHHQTNDFIHIGTKLKIIGKTNRGKLEVQRFPRPFDQPKRIHPEYFNRIVPLEKYVCEEPMQETEDHVSDDEDDAAYVWSTLGLYYFDLLPEHVLYVLLEFCSWDTMTRISTMSEAIGASMLKSKRLQMQSYRCFYTLQDATDSKCILGYGAQKKIMGKRSRISREKKDVLQQLHVSFDVMSYEAFSEAGVRNNIWKDRPVDAFIPLFINEEHGQRAMALNKTLLPALVGHRTMNADTILLSIGKAMNTTVVDMMLSVEDVETGELQMMDSIKALEGYMALHHSLLAYALKYPELVERCEETVGRFIKDPTARDKEVTPDIGELLIALALTNYKWDEFVLAWVEEMMLRSMRWTLAKYPGLMNAEQNFSCVRINRVYQATKTGKRLAMFQRFFVERIASPPELEENPNKLKILFNRYNQNCGRPALGLAEELQIHSRQVLNCEDWFNYFELINFPAPNALRLWKWLLNAMELSEGKRYHERSSIMYWESSHLQDAKNVDHHNQRNCLCTGTVMNITKKPNTTTCTQVKTVNLTQVGIKDSHKLDVAFCVDNTGSMCPWIRSARNQIRLIMKKLRASGKHVRFGFVGYTDHSALGKAPLTRVVDFTKDAYQCQQAVDSWVCTGNLDVPEALAPGLVEVGKLSWDKTAQRICIIITDAPPHGLGSGNYALPDLHPFGDPDGSDVFVAAHTLGTAGVALYPVHCTNWYTDGIEESLYRGLAQRTGGAYLKMRTGAAGCLSDIVLASSMEENTLDDLGEKMKLYYEQVKKAHPIAREEQIIYQIHAAMVEDNIVVTSKMMDDAEFEPALQKQIKDFAECMSIKQCQAIVSQDHFSRFPGRPKSKITSYTGPVTKSQVVRAYARMGSLMATADVEKNGCVFRRKKWQTTAYRERQTEWLTDRSTAMQRKLKSFAPWKELTSCTRAKYTTIPNKRNYKRAPLLQGKRQTNFQTSKKVVGKVVWGDEEEKKVVEETKCDWVQGTVVQATRSMIVNGESINRGIQYRVKFVAANGQRYSIGGGGRRVVTITRSHTDKFTVVSHPAKVETKPTGPYKPGDIVRVINSFQTNDNSSFLVQEGTELIVTRIHESTGTLTVVHSSWKNCRWLAKRNFVNIELLNQIPNATAPVASTTSSALDMDLTDEPQPPVPPPVSFAYDFSNGPVRIAPVSYISLSRGIATSHLNPNSPPVFELTVGMTIVLDGIFKHRAHMASPVQGWLWFSNPATTQRLVRRTTTSVQPEPVTVPALPNRASPSPSPSPPAADVVSITQPTTFNAMITAIVEEPVVVAPAPVIVAPAPVHPPQPFVPVFVQPEPEPVAAVSTSSLEPRSDSIPSDSGSSVRDDIMFCGCGCNKYHEDRQFAALQFNATIQPPLDFSRGPVDVPKAKQYYVTRQRCVVRSQVNPKSSKVGELHTGTVIVIASIFRQRAHMTAPLQGWFWLASPHKALVQEVELRGPVASVSRPPVVPWDMEPLWTVPTMVTPAPVAVPPTESIPNTVLPVPTVVTTTTAGLTPPTILVHDFDATQANDLLHRLHIWGVEGHTVTVVNDRTFEFQVNNHQDGVIAVNWAPMIRGKKVQIDWKPEYLQCRANSAEV